MVWCLVVNDAVKVVMIKLLVPTAVTKKPVDFNPEIAKGAYELYEQRGRHRRNGRFGKMDPLNESIRTTRWLNRIFADDKEGQLKYWEECQSIHHPRFCPLLPCPESFPFRRIQCVLSTSPFYSQAGFQRAVAAEPHILQAAEPGSSHRQANISP